MPYSSSERPAVGDRVRVIHPEVDGDHAWPPVGSEGIVIDESAYNIYECRVDFSEIADPPRSCRSAVHRWVSRLDRLEPALPAAFYLVEVVKGQLIPFGSATFPDGKAAADAAKRLSAVNGIKIQPRPIAADEASTAWRTREKNRLSDGTYQPMPASWDLAPIKDHFLHQSKDEVGKISFTETPAMGVLDRQVRMAPGRYIARFYPQIGDMERKRYIAMIDKADGLNIATTADQIEHVYRNGPSSCMSKGPSHYDSPVHPVRAYAGGDLAVAYLQRDGRINARAVVWPEKMIFGRVYGDEHRLITALEDEGYTRFDYEDTETGFEGARFTKIWDEEKGAYVCPYFDGHARAINPDLTSREGFLILDKPNEYGQAIEAHTVFIQSQSGHAMGTRFCPKLNTFTHDHEFGLMYGQTEEWSYEALRTHGVQIPARRGSSELKWFPHEMVIYVEPSRPLKKSGLAL